MEVVCCHVTGHLLETGFLYHFGDEGKIRDRTVVFENFLVEYQFFRSGITRAFFKEIGR